jgi:Bacterial membrane protein YfhO
VRRWPSWSSAALACTLLATFFAREAVFGGRAFFLRDLHLQWYGQMESFVRAVASGSWPLWDPYVSFGQPMLANPNTQVLYPLTWLNLLMRPYTYYTLYFVLHLVLAGVGTFALARRLGVSPVGALFAGAAWIASGPFLSLGNLWNHLAGAAWMPWTLLAADQALAGSRRAMAGWALATAAAILAGSPDFALLSLVPATALFLERVEWRRLSAREHGRMVVMAAMAMMLAIGIAAAQVLPSLEVARRSSRWAMSLRSRAYWSTHPLALLQTILPISWDALPWNPRLSATVFESREPYLLSVYLGVPVLAFSVYALTSKGVAHRGALAGAAVLCFLIALGGHTPVFELLASTIPPFRVLRFPAKAVVPATLCLGLLGGLGWDAWRVRTRSVVRALAFPAVILTIGVAVLLLCWQSPSRVAGALVNPAASARPDVLEPLFRGVVHMAASALAITLLVVAAHWRPETASLASFMLASLAVLDLALVHADLNPTAPVDLFRWRPDPLKALDQSDLRRSFVYDYQVDPSASRRHLGRDQPYLTPTPDPRELWRGALGFRLYPIPPVAAAFGLFDSFGRDLLGVQPLPLARLNATLFANEGKSAFTHLLRIGAVSYVLALHDDGLEDLTPAARWHGPFFEDIRLFRVPDPLPRAFRVGEGRVGDIDALLDPAFDPRRAVILANRDGQTEAGGSEGDARIVEFRADRVRIQTDGPQPGFVVLVDSYDPGWRAQMDDQPASVLRANVAFRAVPVPAGAHTVELRYRPFFVVVGLAISALSLGGTAVILRSNVSRDPSV